MPRVVKITATRVYKTIIALVDPSFWESEGNDNEVKIHCSSVA